METKQEKIQRWNNHIQYLNNLRQNGVWFFKDKIERIEFNTDNAINDDGEEALYQIEENLKKLNEYFL